MVPIITLVLESKASVDGDLGLIGGNALKDSAALVGGK